MAKGSWEGQDWEAEIAIPLVLSSLAPVSISEFPLSVLQHCRSRLEDLKERDVCWLVLLLCG